MNDCPNGDVRDVLPDYLNDRLAAPRRVEVERHLATCATCRDEVELLRALRATMHRAPVVNVDAIAAAIPPYRAPERRSWTTGWRTAAAIAAIAVGGASFALLHDDAPVARDASAPPVAIAPAPDADSVHSPVGPAVARAPVTEPSTSPAPAIARSRELALAGGSIGDLSDGELSALVDDLESLDALPSAEVEGAQPLSLTAQEES